MIMELTVNYETYDVFNETVYIQAVTKVRYSDDTNIERALNFFKKNRHSVMFALDDNRKGYRFTWNMQKDYSYKLLMEHIYYINYTENKDEEKEIPFTQVKKLITSLLEVEG